MKFNCLKHGETEAEPNQNGDIFCPECVKGEVEDWLTVPMPKRVTSVKPPPHMIPVITSEPAGFEPIWTDKYLRLLPDEDD